MNEFGATDAVVRLEPGDAVDLQVYPQGADGRQLGGALAYGWSSSNEAAALVSSPPFS